MKYIDLQALIKEGRASRQEKEQGIRSKEKSRLRGGSAGCIIEHKDDHHVIGGCHRIHLLRYLGIEDSINLPTLFMFDGGYANEDYILKDLAQSWEGTMKCEEEIPISWKTENGISVTGRPDIVLLKDDKPVLGVELKQVVSIWTYYNVVCKEEPKTDNLIQAAHYSMQLGVPYSLTYVGRSYWDIPNTKGDWFINKARGLDSAELEEDGYGRNRVIPFVKSFPMYWVDDVLHYETSKGTVKTLITKKGIAGYYEAVSKMQELNDLGPIPAKLHANGGKGKSACQYCSLVDICNKDELELQEFINLAKERWSKT